MKTIRFIFQNINVKSLFYCCIVFLLLSLSITQNGFAFVNVNSLIIESWEETTNMIASDGEAGDWFGISVDVYGDYAIVGARDDDFEQGSAYVFKKQDDIWIEEQKLTASDGVSGDWFGISVAIFEDTIFIGSDADDNENGMNAGSVYVYKKNGSSWVEYQKLLASDGMANDYFGRSVFINNHSAIIGAYYDDDIAGSAYVFMLSDGQWVEDGKLIASDRNTNDYFGICASIVDDTAIVGAYRDDNENGANAGSVYVFNRLNGSWYEHVKIIASDGSSDDRFGISLSYDGYDLIVGAYFDDGNQGSVYIFNNTSEEWVEEIKVIASDGENNNYFGRSVSISDNYFVVGAWGDDSASGSIYLFQQQNHEWNEQIRLTASDASENDRFGYQVSIEGSSLISGAYADDNGNGADAGKVYMFEIRNSTDQVDVDQSLFDRGFPIRHALDGDWAAAQSFIPTLDSISKAEIYMRRFGTPEFNLTVELREDHPEGLLVATLMFAPEEIPTNWGWVSFDFMDIIVSSGIEYFIVCPPAPSGVTTSFGYEWAYAFGNQYDDGSFWFTRDGGTLWRDLPTMYEFTFRTYGY